MSFPKLGGRPLPATLTAWQHLEAINQSFEKARAFFRQRAENHHQAVIAAEAAFLDHPSEARLQHWLGQQALADDAHQTATTIGTIIDKRHKDALLDRGPSLSEKGPALVKAAAEEALSVLREIETGMKQQGATTAALHNVAETRKGLEGIFEKGPANPGWGMSALLGFVDWAR